MSCTVGKGMLPSGMVSESMRMLMLRMSGLERIWSVTLNALLSFLPSVRVICSVSTASCRLRAGCKAVAEHRSVESADDMFIWAPRELFVDEKIAVDRFTPEAGAVIMAEAERTCCRPLMLRTVTLYLLDRGAGLQRSSPCPHSFTVPSGRR